MKYFYILILAVVSSCAVIHWRKRPRNLCFKPAEAKICYNGRKEGIRLMEIVRVGDETHRDSTLYRERYWFPVEEINLSEFDTVLLRKSNIRIQLNVEIIHYYIDLSPEDWKRSKKKHAR